MNTPDIERIFAAADKAGISRCRTDVPGSENLLCASDAQLLRFAAALADAPALLDAAHLAVEVLEDVALQSKTADLHRRRTEAAMRLHQAIADTPRRT